MLSRCKDTTLVLLFKKKNSVFFLRKECIVFSYVLTTLLRSTMQPYTNQYDGTTH